MLMLNATKIRKKKFPQSISSPTYSSLLPKKLIMDRHMTYPPQITVSVHSAHFKKKKKKMMLIIGDNENLLFNYNPRGVVQLINRDFNPRIQFLLLISQWMRKIGL